MSTSGRFGGSRSSRHGRSVARPSGVGKRSANSRGVPGWSSARARPEDALLSVDPLVGDAGVVGRRRRRDARRSSSKTSRGSAEKYSPAAEALGEQLEDGEVVARRRPGAASARRRRMTRPSRFVMVPSSSAHWAAGRTTSASSGGLGQEDVGDDQEVQGLEPSAHAVDVRRRDHDVGGHEDAARARRRAVPMPVEHLERGAARLRAARPGRSPRPPRRARGRRGRRACGSPGSWSAFWPCSRPP